MKSTFLCTSRSLQIRKFRQKFVQISDLQIFVKSLPNFAKCLKCHQMLCHSRMIVTFYVIITENTFYIGCTTYVYIGWIPDLEPRFVNRALLKFIEIRIPHDGPPEVRWKLNDLMGLPRAVSEIYILSCTNRNISSSCAFYLMPLRVFPFDRAENGLLKVSWSKAQGIRYHVPMRLSKILSPALTFI